MAEIDGLIDKIDKQHEKKCNPNSRALPMDHVPYVTFIEHFRHKEQWRNHMNNVDSCFMRLLQLDDLFYTKRTVKQKDKITEVYTEIMDNEPITPANGKNKKCLTEQYSSPQIRNSFAQGKYNKTSAKPDEIDFNRDKSEIR